VGGQYDWDEGRLSTVLMEVSAERWLQLAEMLLDEEESIGFWSGDTEKSCWGCEETLLGLPRMLITCKHRGDCTSGLSSVHCFDMKLDILTQN